MKNIFIWSAVCVAATLGSLSTASLAQSSHRAWRCPNNYYTNDAKEAQSIAGCKLVEGGNITVINMRGGKPAGTRNAGATTRPAPVVSRTPGVQVTPTVQGSRDADARKLLEMELSNKQNELSMLQSQYNSGHPERLLSEAQDDTLYQARVDRLSREIERKVADINSIQTEMARLK